MEESLIEKVKHYEFLYDFKSCNYRDLNMRNDAWEEIGREMKMNASAAKESWEKLRKSYLQAMNRRRSKTSGQAAKKIAPWKYEKEMSFLLPYLENRKTHDNLEDSQEHSQDAPDDSETHENEFTLHLATEDVSIQDPEIQTHEPLYSDSSNVDSLNRIKRKKNEARSNLIHEMVEVIKENAALRHIKYKEKIEKEMDETDMLFMSMCKTTKALPPYEQTKIKIPLSNMVLQAQLKIQENEYQTKQQESLATLYAPSSSPIFLQQQEFKLTPATSQSTEQGLSKDSVTKSFDPTH